MQDNSELEEFMRQRKTILQFDSTDGEGWCVSKHLKAVELAKSYHISADYLIEASKDDDMEPIITLPVLYLYRHAAELYLKEALLKLGVKDFHGHNISKLYSELESALLKQGKPDLLPDENAFHSLMEFHSLSPNSTELRYDDNDLVGGESHMLFANFENARFHIRRIEEYFSTLLVAIT